MSASTSIAVARAIVEGLPGALVVIDHQGAVRAINRGASALFGYHGDGLLDRPLAEIIRSFDASRAGSDVPSPAEGIHRDGSCFPLRVVVRALCPPAESLRVLHILDDEPARALPANLRMIVDNLPGCVAYTDTDERFRYANKAYEELGWDPQDVVGRTIREVLGDTIYQVIAPHLAVAMSGQATDYEVELPGNDGTIYRAVKLVPDVDDHGVTHGLFALIADMTQLRRAQAELSHAARLAAIGRLGAGLAHELSQPLTAIQLLASQVVADPRLQESGGAATVELIRGQARRMAGVIKGVLSFANRGELEARPVDPVYLLEDAAQSMAEQLREAGVELEQNHASDLPTVVVDPLLIQQVLTNLVANAIDAFDDSDGETRRITLHTRALADGVELVVEDNGPGIDAELRGRIFEPFFTTKPVGKGTGLGLSICHGTVTAHGGTLTFEPAPNGGARFIVCLPTQPRRSGATATARDGKAN